MFELITDPVIEALDANRATLYSGFDFGHDTTQAVMALFVNEKLFVFREYANFIDTPTIIDMIKNDFPNCRYIAFPDAAGASRKSVNASVSDISLLRKAGFTVRARSTNPFVRDRVASVNNAFKKNKLYIDVERCPNLVEALEQQIWLANGQPDKTSGFDHIVDALGYMVHYLMPVREIKPQHKPIAS
jgi:hypothetical protein